MLFVGLTGSIATGKSTVAKFLKALGCYIIDADDIAHTVYKRGTKSYRKIIEKFGKNILDKNSSIDRKKLGNIVLKDRKKLIKLEEIVHPEVEHLRNKMIEEIVTKDRHAIIIYDVPLLFEKNLNGLFDCTVVVYTDKDTEIGRLMTRNSFDKDEAIKRISLQMPIEEKIERADFVIDNSGSLDSTKKQTEKLFLSLKRLENEKYG